MSDSLFETVRDRILQQKIAQSSARANIIDSQDQFKKECDKTL